jgi:hypothetical protein
MKKSEAWFGTNILTMGGHISTNQKIAKRILMSLDDTAILFDLFIHLGRGRIASAGAGRARFSGAFVESASFPGDTSSECDSHARIKQYRVEQGQTERREQSINQRRVFSREALVMDGRKRLLACETVEREADGHNSDEDDDPGETRQHRQSAHAKKLARRD